MSENIHSLVAFSGKTMPYHRDDSLAQKSSEILDKFMSKYLRNDVLIPYDLTVRREKFIDAFSDLEPYMRKYSK